MATSEREKELNIKRLSEGRWPFSIPYGYREGTPQIVAVRHKNGVKTRLRRQLVRTIEIDPDATSVIQELFSLYAENKHKITEIRLMIWRSFKKRLHTSMIYRILSNSFYVGKMEYDGIIYRHSYGAIISIDLFNNVQYLRQESIAHKTTTFKRHVFPFKRILRCGVCQGNITADIKKDRYIYYKCTSALGRHSFKSVRYESIFEYIATYLESVSVTNDFIDNFSSEVQSDIKIFLDNRMTWFRYGSIVKRDMIARLFINIIDIYSSADEMIFNIVARDIWNIDIVPKLFAEYFYKVYKICTEIDGDVVIVDNKKLLLTLPQKILRMCVISCSIDEIIESCVSNLEDIQGILFDLQLEGRIYQEVTGSWKTVK